MRNEAVVVAVVGRGALSDARLARGMAVREVAVRVGPVWLWEG